MSVTRFRDGNVTVTMDGALEELVKRAIDAASKGSVGVLQKAAQQIADKAHADWYATGTGVKRRTGASGDIQVVTTVSETEVRVSVGSTDTKMVGSKQRALLVHRAGRLGLVKVQVTEDEFYKTPQKLRANFKPLPADPKKNRPADVGTGPYVWVLNPNASDGKFLIPELVRKPATVKLTETIPLLAQQFASKVGGT